MDPITHPLVGASLAQAFLKRRIGPQAVPVLAIASNLPDIDTVVLLTGDPLTMARGKAFESHFPLSG